MENQKVKKRGRPVKYSTEDDRKKAVKETTYMLNKEWYCNECHNNHNYTLAGKHCHLKTKKHQENLYINTTMKKINVVLHSKMPVEPLVDNAEFIKLAESLRK